MPFSREDVIAVTRHLQQQVRRVDPALHDVVVGLARAQDDPGQYLLEYVRALGKVASERSLGANGRVLDLLNASVRKEGGDPIRSIKLELTEVERALYGQREFDLAILPDRHAFAQALASFYQALLAEIPRAER